MKRKRSNQKKSDAKIVPDRAAIWKRAEGMWRNRKPDPIEELDKMKEEWEERLKEQEQIWRTGQQKSIA